MPGPWLSSFPSGWPGEPRDKKARPRLSESLGCGQHWLSAQLVWLQPLPRLRHARSLGIALQPPCGQGGHLHVVGRGGAPSPLRPAFSLHTRN